MARSPGASGALVGVVTLWIALSHLAPAADAWTHRHYANPVDSKKAYEASGDVIQPVVRRSAQLGARNIDAHPRYRRDTLPISYRSLSSGVDLADVDPHCTAWSQSHYRTFDGKTYTFHGACQYVLAMDCQSFTFRISVRNDPACFDPGKGAACNRTVLVQNGDAVAPVELRPGRAVLDGGGAPLELPALVDGLVLERIGDSVVATSGLGYKVVYDGHQAVTVYVTDPGLKHQTCGLCGVYNDDAGDDFKGPFGTKDSAYDFGLSWKEGPPCADVPRPATLCTQIFIPPHMVHFYKDFIDLANSARETCKMLEDDPEFARCHTLIEVNPYIEACQRDICNCELGQDQCACNSMAAYALECGRYGVKVDWRSDQTCPWTCPSDKVYTGCSSTCTPLCGSASGDCEEDGSVGCIESCQCPAGLFQNSDGQCMAEESCPCVSGGVEYDTGATISDGCNQCTCGSGKWTCTDKICETLCWSAGDPHYKTFDDKYYDFMGACSYTLVRDCRDDGDPYEVIVDNAPCGGGTVTCTQKVVVVSTDRRVTLFRGLRVAVHGNDVHLPYVANGILVDQPTSLLVVVSLGNGMVVRWDGKNRVEVVVPPSKFNKTCGMCGTFNKNPVDDFTTPTGDRVVTAWEFGDSWKVADAADDNCPDSPDTDPPDVCDLYSQRKQAAQEKCSKLVEDAAFQPCHRVLNPDPYVRSCRYDFCNGDGNDDHCGVFAQYVSDCRQKSVILTGWRKHLPECDVTCQGHNMTYSECAPSCGATCSSLRAIHEGAACSEVCAEGCHCDQGRVQDHAGLCVPADQCPCYDEFLWFDSGETTEIDCKKCTCQGGNWQCDNGTCPVPTCPANQFYSECAAPLGCQPTCANAGAQPACEPSECRRACECDAGYYLQDGECVLLAECPCTHRGETYAPDEVVKTGCQVCTCTNGQMSCSNDFCPGTCIAWGDPHYQTFDGKKYNFQGECDYVLVTNSHYPDAKQFHIVVANVPCGTGGVTCTKAITMSIGHGAEQERVMLTRGQPIEVDTGAGGLTEFVITEAGLSVLVHTSIGVTLTWDRATRVEVKATRAHSGRVGGLCGNYNDIQADDFLPPGGGIPLVDPNDFGNSWKVHDYCAKPPTPQDPCEANPQRRAWAQKRCGVITSPLFQPCHAYVPPQPHFDDCVYDACGCDKGGDCECLCTAIALYAQACNEQGVPIRWRTQELCPIQCEGCLTYEPCIPVCESCENAPFTLPDGSCADTCVEGCACPPGTYLHEDECVEHCPLEKLTTPETIWTTPTPAPQRTTAAPPTTPTEICECWGYGDPHYFDFNGQEFDDQGQCTYVLAKDTQLPPRFTVLIHNIECLIFPGTTCPKEIEVLYDGHTIRLQNHRNDLGEYEVIIDGASQPLPVTYDSFTVSESGLYILFEAPSIGLQVRYLPVDLHYFKVEVPQVIFYNSTEGLCGNCGQAEPTCEMTETCCDWIAPPSVPSDCGCDVPPTECVPSSDVMDWCQKLYEDPFTKCHHLLPPDDFYETCLYNNCYGDDITCWDFEAYVAECSALGICLDWREDDFCPYDCKDEKTHYRECACPDNVYTSCYPWSLDPDQCTTEPVSGCFCNEGTMDNGNGICVPCPTDVYPTTPEVTMAESTRAPTTTLRSSTPAAQTTTESTPPVVATERLTTLAESTPPASTTVESTPPVVATEQTTTLAVPTTAESTPPASTTVESTPPESTTVESTPPASTTVESTPPVVATEQTTTRAVPTTAESTPPASTTVESTPPESTTVESTPPASTTVKSTQPQPTTAKSTPPQPTTVESTPPSTTTVESTPPASTTVEPTPPVVATEQSTTRAVPTTAESTPPASTTVESTPPESTTVESTPPASTTVESTPPVVATEQTTTRAVPTTAESTPPASTTVESTPPESTTVESTPPASTTVESTPPVVATEQSTTHAVPTTAESTPPASTTVESTPPESTTVESTPPASTTVESTPPVVATEQSTTRAVPTTAESTPPASTTVESTPPESTTVESTPPASTTVESTPPVVATEQSTTRAVPTTAESTPPASTTVESTPPASTTVESTPPESTTRESTTVEESTTIPAESTTGVPPTTECVPGLQKVCRWSRYLDDEVDGPNDKPYEFELIGDFLDDPRYPGVCPDPEAIECVLARDHSVPAWMTTQTLQCSPDLGLACYDGDDQSCGDYAIRVLCCTEERVVCGSTEPPTLPPSTTALAPVTESTTAPESTVPTETTVASTRPASTTTSVPTTERPTTEEPQTTVCVPGYKEVCEWTPYYDDSDSPHGDFEVVGDLQDAHPDEICASPSAVECVLSDDHAVSAHETGQNFTCNAAVGFICLDFANSRRQPYRCYDYSVRFRCCQTIFDSCGSTMVPPVTTEGAVTTPVATTEEEVATTEAPTTRCVDVIEETCEWSPWLDDDDDGKVGQLGELELLSTFQDEYDLCDLPQRIECVLKSNPSVHANETSQVVTCNVDEGLVCLHSEQTDFPPFCFDYMIRVQCCKEVVIPCHPATTETVATTTTTRPESTTAAESTTRPAPITTKLVPITEVPTTAPVEESTTRAESTLPPESTTLPEESTTSGPESTTKPAPTTKLVPITEVPTTMPVEESTTRAESTLPPESTTLPEESTTLPEESTTSGPESTTKPAPTTKLVPITEVPTTAPVEESTTRAESTLPPESTTVPAKSTTSGPESTTPAVESTTAMEPTTPCRPVYEEICEWLPWMDDDADKVGPVGEFELVSSFRDQYDICAEPSEILCALKADHSVLSNATKQALLCSPTEGLICVHADQTGVPRCFDYSIRLKCCRFVNVGCPVTTLPPVTTAAPTEPTRLPTTAPASIHNPCQPQTPAEPVTISKDGCSSAGPVYLPECRGRCDSASGFLGFGEDGRERWGGACNCCRPAAHEVDRFELVCPDGETVLQPVSVITECECQESNCGP